MRHVFVETNFLVEVLRPLAAAEATLLLERHDRGELKLWLPWCCTGEAKRTLSRIIREDLGFTDTMIRFAAVEYRRDPTLFDKTAIDWMKSHADAARAHAHQTLEDRIGQLAARLGVIPPSPEVVARTLSMFSVKTLKPFDEMTAGAVLSKAQELYDTGERDLHFCELDADLAGGTVGLTQAYAACGLTVLRSFAVP